MNATTPNRQFAAKDAKREHVPLLIGLTGPSGGGKTFSALRLATGIQTVTGGDIYFIDTESRRALHYADQFKFKHVTFGAPFGSLDYLAALKFCVAEGAKVVIVDSMSHEHEGPGGMVDLHDQIALRMSGGDAAKLERVKMLAWSEPKQKRRALINGILQLNANFIFCFRAKNTSKPVKGKNGRTEVEAMGFMPIAGEEFVFEQTLNALLLPGAGGVPTWSSEQIGERTMIKLPEQFTALRDYNGPLDEKVGKKLALWASGKARPGTQEPTQKERRFEADDAWPDDRRVDDEPDPQTNDIEADTTTARTLGEQLDDDPFDAETGEVTYNMADQIGIDDPHPGTAVAAKLIAEIKALKSVLGVATLVSEKADDIATMLPEDGARVEIAADKRKAELREKASAA